MFVLVVAAALAEPWEEPLDAAWARYLRDHAVDRFAGDAELHWRPLALALAGVDPGGEAAIAPAWRALAAPEAGWGPGVGWSLRPSARVVVGDGDPVNLGGAREPGAVTTVAGLEGGLGVGPGYAWARPEVALDAGATTGASVRLAEGWAGVRTGGFEAGFGRRQRWLGPGQHAALLLSDHAAPAWMGGLAGDGRLPGGLSRAGRFRGELGLGFLDRPRGDVQRPGLLLLDLRWLPHPSVEIGATRLALFGGVGRPPVDVGQLLLPTEPHIYDDPDQLLPDQNELASLDLRVTLPLRRWWDLPVDRVEAYWQYGGEDVQALRLGPVPYPSLAGVGNLYGGAAAVGPLTARVEHVRLLDDYFRWYTGHRVYHEGFTQDGEALGFWGGGDAEAWWGALEWEADRWRARVQGGWLRRVGVVEALNDRLFTLMTEERTWSAGVDAGLALGTGHLAAGYRLDRVTGEGFVPGADAVHHRVHLTWSPAATFGGRLGP